VLISVVKRVRKRCRSACECPKIHQDGVNDLDGASFGSDALTQARSHDLAPVAESIDRELTLIETLDLTFAGFCGDPVGAWVTRPAQGGRVAAGTLRLRILFAQDRSEPTPHLGHRVARTFGSKFRAITPGQPGGIHGHSRLVNGMQRAHLETQRRRSEAPDLRLSWWPGAGSNRRPSDFQEEALGGMSEQLTGTGGMVGSAAPNHLIGPSKYRGRVAPLLYFAAVPVTKPTRAQESVFT
jgi:hypothetical protein